MSSMNMIETRIPFLTVRRRIALKGILGISLIYADDKLIGHIEGSRISFFIDGKPKEFQALGTHMEARRFLIENWEEIYDRIKDEL